MLGEEAGSILELRFRFWQVGDVVANSRFLRFSEDVEWLLKALVRFLVDPIEARKTATTFCLSGLLPF